jgi:hypothetical protein
MRTALQVIREHGPKYLGELYTENVGPIVGMLGPEGLAELATMKSRLLGYGMGPAAMLYASEAGAGSDVINNVPRAEYTGPNLPLPRPRPRWSDARAEVANLLARDRDRARNRALDELLAHYPPPSAVITDPDINAERESILRALFEDREGLINTIEDRADELMPQRFAGGGLVKRLYRGIRAPVIDKDGQIEQLAGVRMAEPASNKMINTMKGATWWTDNPKTADTYVWRHGGARSVLVPADLVEEPELVLDAGGQFWNEFFPKSRKFKAGMRDPEVRSIMVENIVDPGGQTWDYLPEMKELQERYPELGMSDSMRELFIGNNVLVKDPRVLRYLSGEEAAYARGGYVGGHHGR